MKNDTWLSSPPHHKVGAEQCVAAFRLARRHRDREFAIHRRLRCPTAQFGELAGEGIKITPLSSSDTFFDMTGDGYQHRTAWAAAGNGVLVLDVDGLDIVTGRAPKAGHRLEGIMADRPQISSNWI